MQALPLFDYVVVNHTGKLNDTVSEIIAILTAEKCRVRPRQITFRRGTAINGRYTPTPDVPTLLRSSG